MTGKSQPFHQFHANGCLKNIILCLEVAAMSTIENSTLSSRILSGAKDCFSQTKLAHYLD
jgi:hypothetical protein